MKRKVVYGLLALLLVIPTVVIAQNAPTEGQMSLLKRLMEDERITKESFDSFLHGHYFSGNAEARYSLGRNFITPDEVSTALGVRYTQEDQDHFKKTFPSSALLFLAKTRGYVLVAGPPTPITLQEIRFMAPDMFWTQGTEKEDIYSSKDFVKSEWILLKKECIDGSKGKSSPLDSSCLLASNETYPNVAELSWVIITFNKVRGERLFPSCAIRTSTTVENDSIALSARYYQILFHEIRGAAQSIVCATGKWHND